MAIHARPTTRSTIAARTNPFVRDNATSAPAISRDAQMLIVLPLIRDLRLGIANAPRMAPTPMNDSNPP